MIAHSFCRGALAAACVAVISADALARRNNPPAGVTGSVASGGSDCTACHTGTPGGGSVQIFGVPARYQFNQVFNLTVRVSDALQVGAGFQLSVEDDLGTHIGTLIASDAVNTELNSDPDYINHTGNGVTNSVNNWSAMGNAAEYHVQWQAPATDAGFITFYAAGNAINDNGIQSGDKVYTTSVVSAPAATVPAASSWGLLALALAAMTAGTIVFARRGYNPTN